MNKNDLEERLINYSVQIIEITNNLNQTKAGNHLSGQLIRSGTSVSLNYGEAQSGESRKDFIHKIQIVLKELRESLICLKIINKAKLSVNELKISNALKESEELISIFVKSVETAKKNMENQKK
jgi:four helix bundle protein